MSGTSTVDPDAAHSLCGRCRGTFPIDRTAAPGDWWLCDPCRAILLPPDGRAQARSDAVGLAEGVTAGNSPS
jgi:hypothetical protein